MHSIVVPQNCQHPKKHAKGMCYNCYSVYRNILKKNDVNPKSHLINSSSQAFPHPRHFLFEVTNGSQTVTTGHHYFFFIIFFIWEACWEFFVFSLFFNTKTKVFKFSNIFLSYKNKNTFKNY